jgi:hypothetical protein
MYDLAGYGIIEEWKLKFVLSNFHNNLIAVLIKHTYLLSSFGTVILQSFRPGVRIYF